MQHTIEFAREHFFVPMTVRVLTTTSHTARVQLVPTMGESVRQIMPSTSSPTTVIPILCIGAAVIALSLLHGRFYPAASATDAAQETEPNVDTPTKNKSSYFSSRWTLQEEMKRNNNSLSIQSIGVVRSIYRLCVGTPRQGLLAPQARGRIELELDAHAVDGLQGYSHIWILFIFHFNINQVASTKIAPPARGGSKVGVLATRSPHRFNPIGMTLVQLDRVEIRDKKGYLYVSGLDLVDGTPVVDIKPYVPHYDAPLSTPTLPNWVSQGLATQRPVIVLNQARDQLQTILLDYPTALEFYGPHRGDSIEESFQSILTCIQQVLAVDVRSTFQTLKVRGGKFQAERSRRLTSVESSGTGSSMSHDDDSSPLVCTQQLDNLLISYTVRPTVATQQPASQGSGAEDVITVISIQQLMGTQTDNTSS